MLFRPRRLALSLDSVRAAICEPWASRVPCRGRSVVECAADYSPLAACRLRTVAWGHLAYHARYAEVRNCDLGRLVGHSENGPKQRPDVARIRHRDDAAGSAGIDGGLVLPDCSGWGPQGAPGGFGWTYRPPRQTDVPCARVCRHSGGGIVTTRRLARPSRFGFIDDSQSCGRRDR